MKTDKVSNENENGNNANRLLAPVYPKKFNFTGWGDINWQKPTKNGKYLCVIRYDNTEVFEYLVIEYFKGIGFITPFDNIDLLLWTELPPHPFSK